MLRNHGIVVAANSVEETCIRGVLLEHSAKAQVTATAMGAFSWATDADALLKRKRFYRPDAMINLWEYFVRQLQQKEVTITVQPAEDSLRSTRSKSFQEL